MAKLLTSRDLARVSCSSCEGCGECCRGMDDTIHLDPYDLYELEKHLGKSFDELFDVRIGLAGSMISGRASAACFRSGAAMRTARSATSWSTEPARAPAQR